MPSSGALVYVWCLTVDPITGVTLVANASEAAISVDALSIVMAVVSSFVTFVDILNNRLLIAAGTTVVAVRTAVIVVARTTIVAI